MEEEAEGPSVGSSAHDRRWTEGAAGLGLPEKDDHPQSRRPASKCNPGELAGGMGGKGDKAGSNGRGVEFPPLGGVGRCGKNVESALEIE